MRPFPNPSAVVDMYALGFSLREVAPRYGVSHQTVKNIVRRADPALLRSPNRGHGLEPSERLELERMRRTGIAP